MTERIGRRAFLRRGALAAAAIPLLGAAAACGRRGSLSAGTAPEGIAFGPLPVDPGLELASSLPIERGATLRVYEWKDYLSSRVLASFEQAYAAQDVHIQVESFTRIDEAIARLQDPSSDFDVVFPVIDVLPGMVSAGLLRPLNHDYLPHLSNLWGWFRDGDGPFYDPGQRYTTPYTIYTGGIGWRADMVRGVDAPDARARPVRDLHRSSLPRPGRHLRRVSRRDRPRAATGGRARPARRDLRPTRRCRQLPRRRGRAHQRALHRRRRGGGTAGANVRGAPGVVGRHPDRAAVRGRRGRQPGGGRRCAPLLVAERAVTGRRPRPDGDLCPGAQPGRRARVPRPPASVRRRARQLRVERLPGADGGRDARGVRRSVVPMARRGAGEPPRAIVSEDEFAQGQMLVGFGPSQDAAWLAQWSRVVPA